MRGGEAATIKHREGSAAQKELFTRFIFTCTECLTQSAMVCDRLAIARKKKSESQRVRESERETDRATVRHSETKR